MHENYLASGAQPCTPVGLTSFLRPVPVGEGLLARAENPTLAFLPKTVPMHPTQPFGSRISGPKISAGAHI